MILCKKTGSKYLRTFDNPNKRIQDGHKKHLLSSEAEQEFSLRERWFANNIFFPYLKENKYDLNYSEELAYFLISLLWRVTIEQIEDSSIKKESRLDFLKDVAEEWRLFLSEYKYPNNFNDLNIFFTDRITSHTTELRNVDTYMTRVIDATIVVNDDLTRVAIYVKFLRFIFWSVVKGPITDNSSTKVNFLKGKISIPQNFEDDFISSFITHRIKVIDERPKPNDIQSEKAHKEMMKNEDEFWKSDLGKSMLNDYRLNNKTNKNTFP